MYAHNVQFSARHLAFDKLREDPTSYFQHYVELGDKYSSHHEIYKFHLNRVKNEIRTVAAKERYKFNIYLQTNPNLETSPFINSLHPTTVHVIRFCLGSHNLPIETGRWKRIPREMRLCNECNVLGDENHVLFHCSSVNRTDITIPNNISQIWSHEDVFRLFQLIGAADYL